MKKIILLLLIFIPAILFSQTDEQKQKLESLKDFYKVENGEVVFTKIIEDIPLSKDEIFPKVESYFATAYKSANDVIQQKDKEAGIIIGKGNFKIMQRTGLAFTEYRCNHTIRVDVKDNRARVVISANEYNFEIKNAKGFPEMFNFSILDAYPIGKKANKRVYANIFIQLCDIVSNVFTDIENGINNKNTSVSNDW